MKKILILFIFILLGFLVLAHTEDVNLNAEIQKGRELFEKLQRGEIKCQDLINEDFHSIGEYTMEVMVGGSDHLLMNQIMEKMHGKEAEELMHINMGKRYSGCSEGRGLDSTSMSIMNMPMMGYWWWNFSNWKGWNVLAPFFSIISFLWLVVILTLPILALILLILGILYLVKKLKSEIKKQE